MTKKMFALVQYSSDVKKFRDEVHQDTLFFHQRKFIDRLMFYISEEIRIESTKSQLDILRAAVGDRVGGIINANDFEERLALPVQLGGAAYAEDAAHLISRHLEKLIAQGGFIIRANELLGAHT